MRMLVPALLTLALCTPAALAKDDPARMVKEAEALVRSDSLVDAVRVYAAALRAAEKKKDLPAQEHVTRSMQRSLARSLMLMQARDKQNELQRACLLVLLEGLAPKRTSAFLCRGQVAHALLLDATRSGERTDVAAAAAAAAAHAKLPKTGAYAKMMAAYGTALTHVAAREAEKACPLLQAVLDKAAAEGWSWTAVYAGTELAATHLTAAKPAAAIAALEATGDVLKSRGEYALAMEWRRLVEVRLADASKAVLAPYETALKPHAQGGSSSSKGASGGKGQSAGSRDRSKIGDAWKKLSKRKPFVRVKRTGAGYEIRQSYDKKFEAVQPYEQGVKHHADGGVTLSFWDGGVRLHMIDRVGREGQPGEASQPPPFLFFHALASGETWGVDKTGGVTITSKK